MQPQPWASNVFLSSLYRVIMSGERADLAQLFFDVAVLDRYLESDGFRVLRSNAAGRVKQEGGWSLDFGISPGERLIHTSAGLLQRLPEAERAHWLKHGVTLPYSHAFIQMQLRPGSCYDDGDIRPW